jgi:aspartokinase
LIRRIFSLRRNQLDFNKIWAIILAMALPTEPVILSVEQLDELNRKLSALRHDVNNNLSLMMAATELIRRRPESADRMWTALAEQPQKVAESVAQFSRDLEKALCITRP